MKAISILSLLICLILFGSSEELRMSCYNRCMKKTKKLGRKYNSCIVTNSLKQLIKSDFSSAAKLIVSTIKGAKVPFDECEEYFTEMTKAIPHIISQCKKKCK